jgi:starch-binding outer membrane protein SusE/F
MKNLKIFSAILLVAIIFSTACRKKATDRSILTGNEIAPVLTVVPSGANTLVLVLDSADIKAIDMNWSKADFKFPTNVRYDVQVIKQGMSWDNAAVLNMVGATKASLTHFDLNDLANKFGIAPNTTGTIVSRIRAFIPGTSTSLFSNEVSTVVTAYKMSKPTLSVSYTGADTLNLSKDSALLDAYKMNWEAVNWANPSTTVYELQVIPVEGNWADATIYNLGGLTSAKFSHKGLNKLLLAAPFSADTFGVAGFKSRIKAYVPGTARMAYSDPETRYARTYSLIFAGNKVWLPGDYQSWNHDPMTVQVLEEITPGSGQFEGVAEKSKADGTLSNGGFKITPEANWDYDFGDAGTTGDANSGSGAIGPKYLGTNGPNLTLVDGTYKISVDTVARTWSYTLENWGLIGDATNKADLDQDNIPDGWQSDKNMRYNQKTKMYEITVDLEIGAIKFRKNDGWNTNYGDTGANGSLEGGGDNIAIGVAGNYTIKLDLENLTYTVTKN